MQKFFKIKPTLCRECGTEVVWDYTTKTFVQGWWGPFSAVIANPFTILMNMVALVQAKRLPPPEGPRKPEPVDAFDAIDGR